MAEADRIHSSHWWFTNTYNIEVFQNVSRCFLPTHHDDYTPCPDKPLIISGWWYSAEVVSGGTSGEVSDAVYGVQDLPGRVLHPVSTRWIDFMWCRGVAWLTLLNRPSGRHRL